MCVPVQQAFVAEERLGRRPHLEFPLLSRRVLRRNPEPEDKGVLRVNMRAMWTMMMQGPTANDWLR